MGLSNSPKSIVPLMDIVKGSTLEPYCFVFLDDIIVYQRLKIVGITVNWEKCELCRPPLKYSVFVIDQQSLRADPEKVSSNSNYSTHRNTREIRRLIWLFSWYHRFNRNFISIATLISVTRQEEESANYLD